MITAAVAATGCDEPRSASGVAAAHDHACALLSSGEVRCWGRNDEGQLGDGTTEDRFTPVPVAGVSDAIAVAVGGGSSCAARRDGTAVCWGRGRPGGDEPGPELVAGLERATSVALGGRHACAVRGDGQVMCWGDNESGQLGDGSITRRAEAMPVSSASGEGALAEVIALAVGAAHSCALIADRTVECWGSNRAAELGDRRGERVRLLPAPVPGLRGVVSLAARGHLTCALDQQEMVRCWGSQQIMRAEGPRHFEWPSPVHVGTFRRAVEIAVAEDRACVRRLDGEIECWPPDGPPAPVPERPEATSIALGAGFGCAHTRSTVACWGQVNQRGQLGDGTNQFHEGPREVRW